MYCKWNERISVMCLESFGSWRRIGLGMRTQGGIQEGVSLQAGRGRPGAVCRAGLLPGHHQPPVRGRRSKSKPSDQRGSLCSGGSCFRHRGVWNASSTGAFGIPSHPCIESGPEGAANDKPERRAGSRAWRFPKTKTRGNVSVTVVAASQHLAVEAFVDSQNGD